MADERVVAIVEARMGSSRLPGKSLRPLAGRPLVECVIERLRGARSLQGVVLATSVHPRDDVLARHVESLGVPVFRGSEEDVLARILGAAHFAGATVHVQCWGDCPLVEPVEVDRVVAALLEADVDLAGNGLGEGRTLPYGLDVIALRVRALEEAERRTRDQPYHREHGTTYVYQTEGAFKVRRLETPADLRFPAFDATINTERDFEFISEIYAALGRESPRFSVRDAIALIRSRPDLLSHPNAKALAGS